LGSDNHPACRFAYIFPRPARELPSYRTEWTRISKAENLELRRKLIEAVRCVRFQETGATDAGERAHSMLEGLQSAHEWRRPKAG
jgi:hypothetical protein